MIEISDVYMMKSSDEFIEILYSESDNIYQIKNSKSGITYYFAATIERHFEKVSDTFEDLEIFHKLG